MATKIACEAVVKWNNGPTGADVLKSGWMRGYDVPLGQTQATYSHVDGYDGQQETYEMMDDSPWNGTGGWQEVWSTVADQEIGRGGRLGAIPNSVHAVRYQFEEPGGGGASFSYLTVPHNEGGWKSGQFADLHLNPSFERDGNFRVLEYDWQVRGAGGVGLTHGLRMEALPIPTTEWVPVGVFENTISCPDALTVGSRHGVMVIDNIPKPGLIQLVSYVVSMPGLFDLYSNPVLLN